jgi:CRP-like cAMP-binding protein
VSLPGLTSGKVNKVAPQDEVTVVQMQMQLQHAKQPKNMKRRAFSMGSVIGILPYETCDTNLARHESRFPANRVLISKDTEKEWYVLRHNSRIIDVIHVIVSLCALWNVMEIPVDIAFQYAMIYTYGNTVDIVTDVVVWIYFVVLFFVTVITHQDIELTALSRIAAYRLSSKSFWIDVLTSLPYEYIWSGFDLTTPYSIQESYPAETADHVMHSLLRLPKILRAANILRTVFGARQHSSLVWKLIQMILIYLIVVHFLACGLYFVGMYQLGADHPRGRVRWVDLSGLSLPDTPMMYRYTLSLYWSLMVITSTGFGDITAVSLNEKMFMIFCLSCTVTTSALLFGGLFSIVEKMDAQNAAKQNYKEELMTYLELEKMDKTIVGALLDNTEMYLTDEFVQSTTIFERTPTLFKKRVCCSVYLDSLSTFALTNSLSEKCCIALCSIIKIEVACAGEILSVAGDIQTQLYLIMRGSVAVTDSERGIHYGVLNHGGFFGELALMSGETVPKCKAPALQARENCTFATMSRAQLKKVLLQFPMDASFLQSVAVCRARIFKHNSLPPMEVHESRAFFLMNVIAAIGGSSSQQANDRDSIEKFESEPELLARRSRTLKRSSIQKYDSEQCTKSY